MAKNKFNAGGGMKTPDKEMIDSSEPMDIIEPGDCTLPENGGMLLSHDYSGMDYQSEQGSPDGHLAADLTPSLQL